MEIYMHPHPTPTPLAARAPGQVPHPTPTPLLFALALLVGSTALAQGGVCSSGKNCDVNTIRVTGARGANPVGLSLLSGGECIGTVGGTSTLFLRFGGELQTYYCSDAACASCPSYVSAIANAYMRMNAPMYGQSAGTAAAPAYAFDGDTNTGLYRPAADQLGITTNGTAWGYFSSTAGILVGSSSNAALEISASRSRLTWNTAYMEATNTALTFNAGSGYTNFDNTSMRRNDSNPLSFDDTDGYTMVGAAQTSLPTNSSWTLQRDTNTNGLWKKVGTPSATAPMVDLGGAAHPVLERRTWGVDFGYESTATPTFYPVAPRIGGSAATVTMSETGNSGTTCGATPNIIPCRGTTTAASSGSVASMVTSAFIRNAGMSPRWCQRVSLSTGSNIRAWVGMANALPGSSDNPANGAVSFRYSTTAGDSAWQWCYANGVSTTCATTSVAPSTSTATFDTLCIDCREGMSTACTWWVNGVARARQTSGLPTGSPFFPYFSVEARSAAAVTGYEGAMSVEMN